MEPDFGEDAEGVFLETGGRVVVGEIKGADEVMGHGCELAGGRCGCPDGEVVEKLARVGRHDFRVERLRQLYCE